MSKQLWRRKFAMVATALATAVLSHVSTAEATTVLYVPQDDRPVSLAYTVATAQDAGYTVLTPPQYYISGRMLMLFGSGLMKMLVKQMYSY